jgi:flagellar P-ring protein precursor FlgI
MLNIKSVLFLILTLVITPVHGDRIKDLTDVAGVRSNQLLGFGIVSGLSGTGDGKDLPITAQALKTLLSGMGVSVDGPVTDFDLGDQMATLAAQNAKKEVKVENLASVMVTAEIPPFAKPGQRIDVSVSAIGVAESKGGRGLTVPYTAHPDFFLILGFTADAAIGGFRFQMIQE